MTARCAPLSRQDIVTAFCKSNVGNDTPFQGILDSKIPFGAYKDAFRSLDLASVDGIVDFVCPDKYRAWNFSAREAIRTWQHRVSACARRSGYSAFQALECICHGFCGDYIAA